MGIAEDFETASMHIEYMPHKAFKGVSLKHLVKGEKTGGRISSHLVKVEPFCSLDEHSHPEQTEIHEIIEGSGKCVVAGENIPYLPGTVAVIPQGTPHYVQAGEAGLYILAKFSPSLL
jgi:quercetin dioxygenase-like cupin family protein